jgi:hypothetical protein
MYTKIEKIKSHSDESNEATPFNETFKSCIIATSSERLHLYYKRIWLNKV